MHKQETFEEVAEKLFGKLEIGLGAERRKIWINGANWQQQQNKNLYSEEDLKDAFDSGRVRLTFDKERPFVFKNYKEWFEQFKKK